MRAYVHTPPPSRSCGLRLLGYQHRRAACVAKSCCHGNLAGCSRAQLCPRVLDTAEMRAWASRSGRVLQPLSLANCEHDGAGVLISPTTSPSSARAHVCGLRESVVHEHRVGFGVQMRGLPLLPGSFFFRFFFGAPAVPADRDMEAAARAVAGQREQVG